MGFPQIFNCTPGAKEGELLFKIKQCNGLTGVVGRTCTTDRSVMTWCSKRRGVAESESNDTNCSSHRLSGKAK